VVISIELRSTLRVVDVDEEDFALFLVTVVEDVDRCRS
jgi:hypothetical protein